VPDTREHPLGLARREYEVLTPVLGKLGAPTREAATARAASLALDGAAEI
jgi:hypothetical protein